MSVLSHLGETEDVYGSSLKEEPNPYTPRVPAHARLAPSAASRWTVCTASVGFIEANKDVLPKDSSTYADEGTEAHERAKRRLTQPAPPSPEPDEMDRHVGDYVKWIAANRRPGDRMLVERRTPLFYDPTSHGTVDASLISDRIWIGDLKYGVGVSVEAKDNKQLAIYAESLIRELEVVEDFGLETPVSLNIFQPRDRNNSEPVRTWELTRGQLAEFAADIQFKASGLQRGDPTEFIADPEKQCRFCPAKGICKAYSSYGLTAIAEIAPEPLSTLPDPHALTREQRVKVIGARKALEKWLEAVEDQEVTELLAGAKPLGYKLVEGKTNRQWADEPAAQKLLRNYLTAEETNPPSPLISVAVAEKLLKGKELSTKFENKLKSLITKPAGKPSLVPETDKRPALEFNPARGLENIDVI